MEKKDPSSDHHTKPWHFAHTLIMAILMLSPIVFGPISYVILGNFFAYIADSSSDSVGLFVLGLVVYLFGWSPGGIVSVLLVYACLPIQENSGTETHTTVTGFCLFLAMCSLLFWDLDALSQWMGY